MQFAVQTFLQHIPISWRNGERQLVGLLPEQLRLQVAEPRRVKLHRLELIEGVVRFSLRSQLRPFHQRTTVERAFRDADQSGLKCFLPPQSGSGKPAPVCPMMEALLLPDETQNDPSRDPL
jgi:hypothetical protein